MEIKGIESRQINEWVKRAYDNAVKLASSSSYAWLCMSKCSVACI